MLQEIKSTLEKEYYKVSTHKEELNGQTHEQLIVSLVFQDHPQIPELDLYLMFLPGVEKELDGVSVLQYYTGFTTGITDENKITELMYITNEINKTMVIGHFGFNEFDNSIFIKYTQAITQDYTNVTAQLIITIINTITFQISSSFDTFIID